MNCKSFVAHSPWVIASLVFFVGCSSLGVTGRADLPGDDGGGADSIPVPTLGGTQFWTDLHFFHEWRIQQHAKSNECRLLNENEWQHASGTFEHCLAKLERIKRENDLEPMCGKAVVILHGLAAPRWSMHLLGANLQKEAGYHIFNVEYASTRRTIDDHARALSRVIKSLDGIEEIHLIGHSMGNIVIRRYLAGQINQAATQADQGDVSDGWITDPRIRRIVMIAPPNHGSITARRWSDTRIFGALFGGAGRQLGGDWSELEARLATPNVEFGIIAGGRSNGGGFSFRLPGDDDGRITVATTRLAGASDFIVVPMVHELIGNDTRVIAYTRQFLQQGYFVSAEQRQPIRADMTSARAVVAESPHRSSTIRQ